MPSAILGPAETARNKFVRGEIEAGLVFAANAIEYQHTNPTRAAMFGADARDCYATASELILQAPLKDECPPEMVTMLVELQRRLHLLRSTTALTSAAA